MPQSLKISVWSKYLIPVFLALLEACGGSVYQPDPMSDGIQPVDFVYELDGQIHSLSELRSRPVLLCLMRTSDIVSQIYIAEVKEAFRRAAGDTQFLVLTIEPSESPFVAMYVESEDLPFPIGVAQKAVALGESTLGFVPIVPATYAIDSKGQVVEMVPGTVKADKIVDLVGLLKP